MSNSIPDFSKLNDTNYREWKSNMKSTLQALGVWRIVTGERIKPGDGTPELEKFWQDWDKAAGQLKMRVEHGQETHFEGYEDDPKEIWERLAAFHMSKKPAVRFNAYAELFSLSKKDDESLTSLMVRIDQAMQNIRNLRPATFTLSMLDDELQCMAMIRAL